MIRGIIFDYGNVLSTFDWNPFLQKLVERSDCSVSELMPIVQQSSKQQQMYETGQCTSREFYEEVKHCYRLRISYDEFMNAYGDIFTPLTQTHDLIRRLKPNYRLGLLSNTCECHFFCEIKRCPVFPLFDGVTLSYEVGVMKPDPQIYQEALNKIALPASACVYLDDIPDFVDAARQAGLNAIQYQSHEQCVHDLKNLGVFETLTGSVGDNDVSKI